eukprot:1900142-Rhodomonas_salina.1
MSGTLRAHVRRAAPGGGRGGGQVAAPGGVALQVPAPSLPSPCSTSLSPLAPSAPVSYTHLRAHETEADL